MAILVLAGCGPKAKPGAGAKAGGAEARFAGLEEAILAWRNDIQKADAACQDRTPGRGCQTFEVACKAERPITPAEQARGVSAKVVAGMSWTAWDPQRAEAMPVSGFSQFTNTRGTWSRGKQLSGNLATCEIYGAKPA
jgi:hypothetical protein